ncbi:MAG: hypothetical protein ACREB5_09230, partial [Sphingomonadaceae bacterium]
MGGFGSAVLESLSDQGITGLPTNVLGLPDWFIEQGPQDLLREKYGLTAEGIYQGAKALLAQVSSPAAASGRAADLRPLRAGQGQRLSLASLGREEQKGDEQGS